MDPPEHPGSLRALLVVAALSAASFGLALGAAPLADDAPLLERIRDLRPVGAFRENYWGELHRCGLYRPLALCLALLERALFDADLAGYRAMGIALHAGASLLVFRALCGLLGGRAALAGAALFACHPVHAEAAITIYGQSEVLAGALILLAFERHVDAHRRGATGAGAALPYALFLLALLTKESAVVLPILLVLARGLYLEPERSGAGRWVSIREAIYAVPFAIYLAARTLVLGGLLVPSGATIVGVAGADRHLAIVIVSVAHALRLSFLPWGQTVDYGHLRDSIAGFPANEALWLLAAVPAMRLLGPLAGSRALAFGAGWFAIALLPVANVIPIGTLVAERLLYLPSVSVSIMAGALWARLPRDTPAARRLAALCLALTLLAGVGLSARVSLQWRDPVSLWRTTVADHPRSPRAHAALGLALLRDLSARGELSGSNLGEARAALDEAVRLNPDLPEAYHGLGLLALFERDPARALPHLRRALALRPGDRGIERSLRICEEAVENALPPPLAPGER